MIYNNWMFFFSSIQSLLLFIYSITLMSNNSYSASVPVSWVKSPFFTSGQMNIIPGSSGTNFTFSTTYSPALTASPPKQPSLGFTDMNYQFTLPTTFIRVDLSTYSRTGLSLTARLTFSNSCLIKLYYLAPDPSLPYFYNSFQWSTANSSLGPFTGPFNSVNVLGISGLSGPGMNISHEISMLVFINGFNLTSTSNCFELILTIRVYNSSKYQLNFTSNCVGMVASFVSYSRIFFDVTAIEDYGYQFFQYGTYRGFNSDSSTLQVQLRLFIPGNFLLGISQFKYSPPLATPIILSFNTTLATLVRSNSNTAFQRLGISYWSLTYRYCPPEYPIFHLDTQTCHNECPDNTYYSSSVQMCLNCFYTCKTCTAYPACTSCQQSQNRILNGTSCLPNFGHYENGTAYAPPCSQGCIDCTNDSICIVCDSGYSLNSSSKCQRMCMQGCNICQTLTNCTVCDTISGYYLQNTTCFYCNTSENKFINLTSLSCQFCTIVGCTNCFSLTACTQCDLPNSYAIEGLVCEYCNNSLNQFINSSNLCDTCSQVGCITCLSLSTCSLCNISQSYYIYDSTCLFCNSSLNYFINSTNNNCEICTLNQCLKCASLSQCFICNINSSFYLDNGACYFCNNSLNYFINLTSQCQLCSIQGCLVCFSLNRCINCDTNHNFYSFGLICNYCNNSLNDFIDPNTLQCQTCSIQNCLQCSNLSTCRTCNITEGYFLNSSLQCQLCNLEGCLECQTQKICKVCDSSRKYSLNSSNLCSLCGRCNCFIKKQLPVTIPFLQYPQQQCQTFQKTDSLLYSVAIISLTVGILATFSTCLIGIELIGVLQLAFLNLADNLYIHLYLSSILGWYYVNGYNIKPLYFDSVPKNVQQIGYTNTFLSNFNVMYGILVFSTILLIFTEVLARLFSLNIKKIQIFTRQFFMATYLFNCLNASFCVGLSLKYHNLKNDDYTLNMVATFSVIPLYIMAVLWLSFVKKLGCGQYTQRFKEDSLNQLYIPITIVYRFGLGLYISMDNQSDNGTLFVLALSLAFVMFNLINLSYKKFYHNYRANIAHITHLIILLVTNYYRNMKKNTPIEVKALINSPAILQIIFICLCVSVAFINTLYQIIVKIKRIWRAKYTRPLSQEEGQKNANTMNESHLHRSNTITTMQNCMTKSQNNYNMETQFAD